MMGNAIRFNCDNCGVEALSKPSDYRRKKRHFCSTGCYSDFRKNKLPKEEQNSYKGGGMSDEDKSIRIKARSDLNHAVRDGKLKREPCSVCGSVKSEAHHEDYKIPLNVIWLCDKHHHEEHSRIHQNADLLKGG